MAARRVRLKFLLEERHWRNHRTFCAEYEKAAISIDPRLRGTAPSRAQLHRWLSGELQGLPYGDHCQVLERMFPKWSAGQLFESVSVDEAPEAVVASVEEQARTVGGGESRLVASGSEFAIVFEPQAGDSYTDIGVRSTQRPLGFGDSSSLGADRAKILADDSLLVSIPPSFSTDVLSGFWVTSYEYDSTCHAEISQLIPKFDRRMTIKNYPPAPRVEGRVSSFRNEVQVELVNRHLVGNWKNINDAYYFGSIHLAILPGETVMEGYYTCFLSDVQVASAPWKWVRLDPASLSGVELSRVTLQEPRLIYTLVQKHSQHDMPLSLTAVTEGI